VQSDLRRFCFWWLFVRNAGISPLRFASVEMTSGCGAGGALPVKEKFGFTDYVKAFLKKFDFARKRT
jgi:hypothetical protein